MTVPEVVIPEAAYENGTGFARQEPSTPSGRAPLGGGETPGSVPRSPALDGLADHADRFQLDAFNRARLSGSSGKGLGRLLGFARSPRPAAAAASPGTPEHLTLSTDDLLVFSEEGLPTSLLKHGSDNAGRAVKMFSSILTYQGVHGDALPPLAGLELIQKLLHQGLKRAELRDELYMQLIKQTRGGPGGAPTLRAWQLLLVVAASMPPGRDFTGLVSEYVHTASRDEAEDEGVRALAARTWAALKRTTKAGQRRTLPEMAEIDALLKGVRGATVVYFLDETFEEVAYDMSTTVAEAVEAIASQIKLEHYQTFSLFSVHKSKGGQPQDTVGGGDEQVSLDDTRYIADVLFDFKAAKAKEGTAPRLLFRKKMFRETDEAITEPRFMALSYIQAQHDYLEGQYPVIRDDAAQMAALQMHAAHGSELARDGPAFEAALEKYVTRAVLSGRPREEWRADVGARYRALAASSRDEAQAGFLRIIRSLPYGNAAFFTVRKIDDPIGLLPAKDAKINELVEELGSKELLLAEAGAAAAGAAAATAELAELRELRADVERRERQQAEVVASQAKRLEELDRLYREESLARKKAHNALEDAKGKIRVYCRVRPLLPFERERGQEMAVQLPDELTISLTYLEKKREYAFDAVFPGGTPQERVFEDTRHLIQSAVDGYNVCIFAYGQTGSGKTFTIYGNEELPGLTPRGVTELFDIIDRDAGKFSFRVEVSLLELYCDDLQDLLAENKAGEKRFKQPKLDIKKDPKGVVTVPGATIVEATSARGLLATIEAGLARRHVSSTAMNRESSRSHLIITIGVEATNLQTQSVSRGKLSFVDLAGSERVKKSKSEGAQLKEAQAINKSLSALGNVIAALATEQGHVPYRDHKLTMLMSDSIGGTAKTLMFVNVSPVDANLDETNNSLQYATRVSTIRNEVGKNEANKDVLRLQRQVAHWKEQAGLAPHLRDYVDLVEIKDAVQNGEE